jgi:hypothetical protein
MSGGLYHQLPQLQAAGVGAVLPIPPFIHPPSEIRALQSNVASRSGAVDAGVRQCVAVDDATRQGWGSFYIQCRDFSEANVPDGIFVNDLDRLYTQGTNLRDQIDEWAAKLNSAPYNCNVPIVAPPSSTVTKIVKTVVWGSVAVVGAYVIYKWAKGNLELGKAVMPVAIHRALTP